MVAVNVIGDAVKVDGTGACFHSAPFFATIKAFWAGLVTEVLSGSRAAAELSRTIVVYFLP